MNSERFYSLGVVSPKHFDPTRQSGLQTVHPKWEIQYHEFTHKIQSLNITGLTMLKNARAMGMPLVYNIISYHITS